jgi:hypothetical protein
MGLYACLHFVRLVDGKKPKVPRAAPWQSYLAYKLYRKPLVSNSVQACACTPYFFQQFSAIFGLTGSVGGDAEVKYLKNTYKALTFDVPNFLDTCTKSIGAGVAPGDFTYASLFTAFPVLLQVRTEKGSVHGRM